MPTGVRSRRGRRPKTYAAVLDATARLLESTSLADLTVAQILAAADVGRTSFYEHFSSKEDVVVKLMRSISAEAAEELEPMFQRGERPPDEAFREGLANLMRVSARYAPLLLAVIESWPAVPELRGIWFGMLGEVTQRMAGLIDAERAAGVAPPGADSAALAAALVWTTERSFHVALTGVEPALPSAEAVVDPLVALFVGAIYGRPARRT